ncbi:DEAD-box ATP-dependent RNA helicase 57 [Galdieria sulphuraria]|nr:DEAD-box ATP-dependent RNA helicase 57 [Galdieria sulphuraria]
MDQIMRTLFAGTSCTSIGKKDGRVSNKTENLKRKQPDSDMGGESHFPSDIARFESDSNSRANLERYMRKHLHIRLNKELRSPSLLLQFHELHTIFGVSEQLLKRLDSLGYHQPTPIQRQVIPCMLSEMQVLACSATGSGKTLAFVIPIISKLLKSRDFGEKRLPQAVILEPTKEMVLQTERVVRNVAHNLSIQSCSLMSTRATSSNQLTFDIIVATPYSFLNELREGKVQFLEQIDEILSYCPSALVGKHLFSATLPDAIETMSRSFIDDPVRVIVGRGSGNGSFSCIDTIDQQLKFTGNESGKRFALEELFINGVAAPVLIFVQNKKRVEDLFRLLSRMKISTAFIHSDCSQEHRSRAVEDFKRGFVTVLVTSDLLCRGMDFRCIQTVINYDFPTSLSTYIHRIGRTGRAGRRGVAISFFGEEDKAMIRPIANFIAACGSRLPDWIFSLPAPSKSQKRKLERRPPKRGDILPLKGT